MFGMTRTCLPPNLDTFRGTIDVSPGLSGGGLLYYAKYGTICTKLFFPSLSDLYPVRPFGRRRRRRCSDAPVSPNAGGAVWFEDLPPAPPAPDTIGVLDEEDQERVRAEEDRRPPWGRRPLVGQGHA